MDKKIKMEQDLIKIINISIFAPSGDNSQPWKFKIIDNTILVYGVFDRDISLYNYNKYASMVSIGALLENIKISASHFKYNCHIKFIENFSDDLIAVCSFKESLDFENPLFKYIDKRQTNRKPYKKTKINKETTLEIEDCNVFPDLELKIITDEIKINSLAKYSSINEKIVLENKKLHDFLFNHITWSEEEDNIKKGFYIKTLELKGPQKIVFRILKLWRLNKVLNKIGMSDFVSKDNFNLYKNSGAMITITSNEINQLYFLKTGMLSQKIWLTATKNNLFMQPLTGIIFLNHRINNDKNENVFNPKHIELIKNSYENMKKVINPNNKEITIMFRLGAAPNPSASTKRLKAEIEIKE